MLLSFRLNDMSVIPGGPGRAAWWDKVPSKFDGWGENRFRAAGFRAVPGCVVRRSAYIAPGVVLMPCFVNLGAYVDEGTMVDTWATVGSCAQIGKRCHISGGAGIGGVLEPLQAGPVVIEDDCFIGARAEVAEGVIVRRGSVLSMGVYLGASTRIVDRETGKIAYGEVPPYSVVVSGSMPGASGGPALYCAVIVKKVDERPAPRPPSTSCCAIEARGEPRDGAQRYPLLWLFFALRAASPAASTGSSYIFLLCVNVVLIRQLGGPDEAGSHPIIVAVSLPIAIATAYANIALAAKRLHDGAYWGGLALTPIGLFVLLIATMVLGLAPPVLLLVIASLAFTVWVGVLPGTAGPNRFGDVTDAPPP